MAKVLTGISGNLISAASAGFAPTNSADVSAIASAYQVVSATATQLYAGTAYVTSVNDAPLSASRAGNAANASLANSAWYDGTGRLISALPDSAAVSAIASSYAESAASGKQNELTFSYDDGKISAINGSALAGQGGGAVTSVQSALDPWYQTSISGLNGSALYSRWSLSAGYASAAGAANYASTAGSAHSAPTAWASSFITGVASPSGTIRVLDGTAIEGTNSAMLPSKVLPGFESASSINAESWSPGTSIGPGVYVTGTIPYINPYTNLVLRMGWGEVTVSISGDNGETASVSKVGSDEYVTAQLPNAASYSLTTNGWVTLYAITASAVTQEVGGGVGELAWASALPTYSYDAEDKISAINGSAIAGGGGGGASGDYVETSATNVAIGSSVDARNDDTFAQGRYCSSNAHGLAQGYHNRASSNSFAQGSYNNANIYSFAQGSDNNAASDGFAQGYKNTGYNHSLAQGERNSADMYSFAQGSYNTAYGCSFAQGSGVSAKSTAVVFGRNNLSGEGYGSPGVAFVIGDGTASSDRHDLMVVTKDGEITMYSGTADTAGTGIMSSIRAISAAATGGGGVDSATVSAIASSYAESAVSSVSSNYYTTANESGYALSSDVSATVDLVGTQSANWGGSALALSAGPGVTLSKSGNTLTINTETVLWSGTPVMVSDATVGLTLAESPYNFDRVALYWVPWDYTAASIEKQEAIAEAKITSAIPRIGSVTEWYAEANNTMFIFSLDAYFDSSKFYTKAIRYFAIGDWIVNANGTGSYITKIVGINRTAEA